MKIKDALLRMRSYAPNGHHPDWADRIEEEINTLSAANDWSKGEIKHLRFIVKMLLYYIDTEDMRELDLRIARAALAKEDKP
jgi:hypothetical protein